MGITKQLHKTTLMFPARVIKANEAIASEYTEDEDVMYVGFTLCHEGANTNGDRFTLDEMKEAWSTIIHKPINWEHAEPNLGVVLDSKLKLPDNPSDSKFAAEHSPAKIDCVGSIWKRQYPEHANLLKKGATDGSLMMSMEAWFKSCDYVVGEFDEVIPEETAEDDMQIYLGTYAEKFGNKFISRALKNVLFGGAGITAAPADKEATIWACANEKSDGEYHDYLHDVYEGRRISVMKKDLVIVEHERITRKLQQVRSV